MEKSREHVVAVMLSLSIVGGLIVSKSHVVSEVQDGVPS
jgi:hypothetical protein